MSRLNFSLNTPGTGNGPRASIQDKPHQRSKLGLRFLQIWNSYRPVLDALYGCHPTLPQQSFTDQNQEIIRDGLGATRMIIPDPVKLGQSFLKHKTIIMNVFFRQPCSSPSCRPRALWASYPANKEKGRELFTLPGKVSDSEVIIWGSHVQSNRK